VRRKPGDGEKSMANQSVERTLLFGMTALQQQMISREAMTQAIQETMVGTDCTISQRLLDKGLLTELQVSQINTLIEQQIDAAGQVSKLIESLPSSDGVLFEICSRTDNSELINTIAAIPGVLTNTQNQLHASETHNTELLSEKSTEFDQTIKNPESASEKDSPTNLMETEEQQESQKKEPQKATEKSKIRVIRTNEPETKFEFRYETFFEFLPKLDYLAEGAMGAVYRAEDREFGRRVALKQVKSNRKIQMNDSIQSSFFLEGEVTGRLDHPGVLPMYGLGRTPDGLPFYAMKYIGSPAFTSLIEKYHENEKQPGRDQGEANQELRSLLAHLKSACLTIQYAHDNGVLHCDIKPDNIMTGEYGETYVVDWGLALLIGAGKDSPVRESIGKVSQTVIPRREESRAALHRDQGGSRDYIGGSPAYMSPEHHQCTADRRLADMSPACDVFSLGVTLYQILTGVVPVNAIASEEYYKRFSRMRSADYLPPRQLKATLDKPLESICLKAIAKEPAERYQSAKALADDIDRWLAGEPVSAYRENFVERSGRWSRKHRSAVAAIASSLLILTFFALITAGLLSRKNAELAEKNGQIENQNQELEQKNILITNERNRAESNQKLAEKHEKMAVEAVREYADSVSENEQLKNRPELEALRQNLLKSPIDFFRRLNDDIRSSRDVRPESLFSLAEGVKELAKLTDAIGNRADAQNSYREAVKLFRDLAAKSPGDQRIRGELAASFTELGLTEAALGDGKSGRESQKNAIAEFESMVKQNPADHGSGHALAGALNSLANLERDSGAIEIARGYYNRSIEIRETLAKTSPQQKDFQIALARTIGNLALLEKNAGNNPAALSNYRRAIEIGEKTAAGKPDRIEYQNDLALLLLSLANLEASSGNLNDAEIHYQSALKHYDSILNNNPSMTIFQLRKAASLAQLGILEMNSKKHDSSRTHFSQAIEILDNLVKSNPQSAEFRRGLGFSLLNLGNLEFATGNPATARVHYSRAAESYELLVKMSPEVVELKNNLAAVFNNIGAVEMTEPAAARAAFQRAVEIREELVKKVPGNPLFQLELGGSYFNLARLSTDDSKAIDLLRKAIESQSRAVAINVNNQQFQSMLSVSWAEVIKRLDQSGNETLFNEFQALIDTQIRQYPQNPGLTELKSFLQKAFAWFIVTLPDRKTEEYQKALDLSTTNLNRNPKDGISLRLKSAALYRLGQLQNALDANNKAIELNKMNNNGDVPLPDLAIQTLIQHRTGQKAEATINAKKIAESLKSADPRVKKIAQEALMITGTEAKP
jgi:serine/threonine protein kinase